MSLDHWEAVRARNITNGRMIRNEREAADLTLNALCLLILDKFDVIIDTPTLSRIENGVGTPTVQQGLALSLWLQDRTLQTRLSVEPPLPGMETAQPTGPIYTPIGETGTEPFVVVPLAHARMGDPRSSEATVRSIAADRSLADLILSAATYLLLVNDAFDDGDLTEAIESMTGRRHQRNVIARARGLLEPSGDIVRVGPIARPDRRVATVHFTTKENNQ